MGGAGIEGEKRARKRRMGEAKEREGDNERNGKEEEERM